MIKKLKTFIRNWTFKEEVDKFNKFFDSLEELKQQIEIKERLMQTRINEFDNTERFLRILQSQANESIQVAEDTRKLINSICDVSVDLHETHPEENWAVICIHGKTDYVRFVELGQRDIREIENFLKQFKYSNRMIDTPSRYLREEMLKW